MIYFTELKKKPVFTEDNIFIGRLSDVVFDFKKSPKITKIIVACEKPLRKKLYIPTQYIQNINQKITIAKNYSTSGLSENELFVTKNLIDKQIIDIAGRKVVRVNDVVFKKKETSFLTILGVDTSIMGILRWFGLDNLVAKLFLNLRIKLSAKILPWSNIAPLELSQGKVVLNINQDKLERIHPEDLAEYLQATNIDNIAQTIKLLDRDFAADVIAELNLGYQIQLFKKIGSRAAAQIISHMDPDEAVDAVNELSTRSKSEIFKHLKSDKRRLLSKLASFGTTEVGEYLTSEYLLVLGEDTAAKVIERIKKAADEISFLNYIYVVNKSEQLIGVFDLHELVMQQEKTPVKRFMSEEPIVSHMHTPLYVVYRKLIKYKLSALPVVDYSKKIIGVVTFDDIAEVLVKNKINSQ